MGEHRCARGIKFSEGTFAGTVIRASENFQAPIRRSGNGACLTARVELFVAS
jgi:hypothetical protein